MCTKSRTCRCHLLKPAITMDKKEIFREVFFKPTQTEEDYLFLKSAYAIIELSNSPKSFKSALVKLNSNYIVVNSSKEININSDHRQQFNKKYDEYLEGDCTEKAFLPELGKLVNYIEKLTFSNLSINQGFTEHLEQYDVKIVNDIKPQALTPDKSNICVLF